jgi:hypothetical protein
MTIDNATYLIDTIFPLTRDEAKTVCGYENMTLVSFEGSEQKWNSINNWLHTHGINT